MKNSIKTKYLQKIHLIKDYYPKHTNNSESQQEENKPLS